MSEDNAPSPEVLESPSGDSRVRTGKRGPAGKSARMFRKARRSGAILSKYAKRHRRWFVRGSLFSILLVAVRVAMPWPLQALIKPWLSEGEVVGEWVFGWHPALVVGLVYALMVTVLGFADYGLRLNFARFSIGVLRDVRAAVIKGIRRLRGREGDHTTGDLVTRLIGDSARAKAGIKGFLVHVATNGLLFVGISGVLLWMDWRIGLVFLAASLLTVFVTFFGASKIFRRSLKFRRKETKIADTIAARLALNVDEEDDEDGLDDESLGANRSSGRHEATITRIQGRTTLAAHIILAVAVPVGLWLAYSAVTGGQMDPSELFIVMLYALMILGPMVRLTRQGARSGKILANVDRLGDLLEATTGDRAPERSERWGLREGISLEKVSLRTRVKGGKRRWFGPLTLEIPAGQKVAVIGASGVGKSALLSILAGRESYKGSIRWDGSELRDADPDALGEEIAYVSQVPNWPYLDPAVILDKSEAGGAGKLARALLRLGEFKSLRSRLREVGGEKILPEEVSHSERKVLAMIRCGASGEALKLIDDPVADLDSNLTARRFLTTYLKAQGAGQTVIVALDRPVGLKRFDRVLVLKKCGRVAFDGSAEEWKIWKSEQVASEMNKTTEIEESSE